MRIAGAVIGTQALWPALRLAVGFQVSGSQVSGGQVVAGAVIGPQALWPALRLAICYRMILGRDDEAW